MPFPRLLPVDQFNGAVWSQYDGYGYGVVHVDAVAGSYARYARRINFTTMAVETGFDAQTISANHTVESAWACPLGIFLECLSSVTQKYDVYFSPTWSGTYTRVLQLGDIDGGTTQNHNVQILHNFCYDSVRGCVYIGEYNTKSAAGVAGDYVIRLMKTTNGTDWSELARWNAAATTQAACTIRHLHGISQDPYTGYVWISTGDSPSQSHQIEWNPTTGTWADDLYGTTLNARTGFRCWSGDISSAIGESARSINTVFTDKYAYWFADSDAPDGGVFRVVKATGAFEPCQSNYLDLFPSAGSLAYGWIGMALTDGRVLLTQVMDASAAATQHLMRVYANDHPDSRNFRCVGVMPINSTDGARVRGMFYIPGTTKFCISITGIGAQEIGYGSTSAATGCTAVLQVNGDFVDHIPHTLAPCRWVSTTGSDANSGQDPRNSWATLKYALTAKFRYGVRVMMGAGTFTELDTVPVFTPAVGAVTHVSDIVTVTGAGVGSTIIDFSSAGAGVLFAPTLASTMLFENLSITSSYATGSGAKIWTNGNTNASNLIVRDCDWGVTGANVQNCVVQREGTFLALRSKFRTATNPGSAFVQAIDTNTYTTVQNIILIGCILAGGDASCRLDQAVTFRAFNCVFKAGQTHGCLYLVTTAAALLQLHNNIFEGVAVFNSISPTLVQIGKNYAEGTQTALVALGGTLVTTGGAWVAASSNDYTPTAASTCISAGSANPYGLLVDTRYMQQYPIPDINGGAFKSPATIGPVEYLPGQRVAISRNQPSALRAAPTAVRASPVPSRATN